MVAGEMTEEVAASFVGDVDEATWENIVDERSVPAAADGEGGTEEKEASEDDKVAEESSGEGPEDLKETINIVHDLASPFEPNQEESAQIESSPHPVQQAVTKVVKDVQGWSDEHLVPKLEAIHSSVAPHVENVKSNTARTFEAVQKGTRGAIDNTGKTFQAMGKSTKEFTDTHVGPRFDSIKSSTSKTLESVGSSTKKGWDEHVVPNYQACVNNTSKTFDAIGASTRSIVDEHVVPSYQKAKENTYKTIEQVSTVSRQAYAERVKPYTPYFAGTAPALFASAENVWYMHLLEGSGRAFGQVVFCNNPVTGAVVFLAMCIQHPLAAVCALFSVTVTNLTVIYLQMDTLLQRKGLYGYNSVLVGSGVATFLRFEWGFVMAILVSVATAPLTLLAYAYTTSVVKWPLHLPADGILIVILLSAVTWDATTVSSEECATGGGYVSSLFSGLSQMFLVCSPWSGVFIAVGMLLCSRILATAALTGSLLGMMGSFLGVGGGSNAALTCLALVYFVALTTFKPVVMAATGGLLALLMHSAVAAFCSFLSVPITTMTLPFCLASLPFLIALDSGRLGIGVVQLIPSEELSTPEEYLAAALGTSLPSTGLTTEDVDGKEETGEIPMNEQPTEPMNEQPTEESPLLKTSVTLNV
jgi:urea transporter